MIEAKTTRRRAPVSTREKEGERGDGHGTERGFLPTLPLYVKGDGNE